MGFPSLYSVSTKMYSTEVTLTSDRGTLPSSVSSVKVQVSMQNWIHFCQKHVFSCIFKYFHKYYQYHQILWWFMYNGLCTIVSPLKYVICAWFLGQCVKLWIDIWNLWRTLGSLYEICWKVQHVDIKLDSGAYDVSGRRRWYFGDMLT